MTIEIPLRLGRYPTKAVLRGDICTFSGIQKGQDCWYGLWRRKDDLPAGQEIITCFGHRTEGKRSLSSLPLEPYIPCDLQNCLITCLPAGPNTPAVLF